MRANIKHQSSLLKKLLKDDFGIEIKHHQAIESVARINGFSDYHAFLKGVGKLDKQIFFGNTVHAVLGSSYCLGEDAVCFLLGHLFNTALQREYCVMDARGNTSDPKIKSEVVTPESYLKSMNETEGTSNPFWSALYRGLLADSNIFDEVLVSKESLSNDQQLELLVNYFESKKFSSAIVTGKPWWEKGSAPPFFVGLDSFSNLTPIYHVSVAHSHRRERTSDTIDLIRSHDPLANVICWISSHHDAPGGNEESAMAQILFDKQNEFGNLLEIPGLGFVSDDYYYQKFSSLLNDLDYKNIPFIKIPYFENYSIFTAGSYYHQARPFMAQDAAIRDALALNVLDQLVALGFTAVPAGY